MLISISKTTSAYYNCSAFLETGETKPCPNEEIYYEVKVRITDDQGYSHDVYPTQNCYFQITNGTIINQGYNYIRIKWKDNGQYGSLKVTNIYCSYGNAGIIDITIKICSLFGRTPTVIIGNNQIDYCDNTTREFLIDTITDKGGKKVDQYKWIIPSGWMFQGNMSNGVDGFFTTVPSILVTPNDCTGGKITVKGVNSSCPSNNYTSNTRELPIYRNWPNFNITGYGLICTTRTYTISNFSSDFSVNWNPGSNVLLQSTQGSVPADFSKNGNGIGSISATISINSCPTISKTISKTVWVGKPAVYSFGNHLIDAMTGVPMYDFCYGTHNDCQAVHPAGEAYIQEWQWQGTSATIYPYGYTYQYATIYPNDYSSFGVEIRARNECGWSEWSRMWVTAINCSSYYMIMSPNPADSYVELNFIEEKDIVDKNNITEIKKDKRNNNGDMDEYLIQIFDKNGTVRKSVQSNSLKINISIQDLEPDTYFLHLTIGNEIYKQQLLIN